MVNARIRLVPPHHAACGLHSSPNTRRFPAREQLVLQTIVEAIGVSTKSGKPGQLNRGVGGALV
jgi:hypothetical protein